MSVLANDIGQDGNPADCQDVNTEVKNCDFDPASLAQNGTNGLLEINTESGDATYTTYLDPSDPDFAAIAAGTPCAGVLDTFSYTLIGYEPDVPVGDDTVIPLVSGFLPVPDSTNTTPASPQNVSASLASPAAHGKAVVAADGSSTYTRTATSPGRTASPTRSRPPMQVHRGPRRPR